MYNYFGEDSEKISIGSSTKKIIILLVQEFEKKKSKMK